MELNDMEKRAIEKNVAALLTGYGYDPNNDDYVNIVDFVKGHGFSVSNALLPNSEDGFLVIRPDASVEKGERERVIGVNVNRSFELKRFIIAHEFAHWVLHYKQGNIFLHRQNRKGKGEEENDADYFAASLLVPRESFTRIYQKFKAEGLIDNVINLRLAEIYKVPSETILRRVGEVDLDGID